jgi:hypothetical protein
MARLRTTATAPAAKRSQRGTTSARAPLRASRQEDEHHWRGSSLLDQKRRQATASSTISARAPLRASRQEDGHHRRSSSLRPEGLASHREQHGPCTSTIARAPPDRRTSITGAAVAFDQKRRQATTSSTISVRAPLRASRQGNEHHRCNNSLRPEGLASHREQHGQCTSTIARLQTGGRASLLARQ